MQLALRLYRQHLARFFFFRLLKLLFLSGYRLGYQFICLFRQHPASGAYDWCALSTVGLDVCSEKRILFDRTTVEVPISRFLGYMADTVSKATPVETIHGPEQAVYALSPAVVVGGIDTVFSGKKAIHHDLFQPVTHRCPAENVGVLSQEYGGSHLQLYLMKHTLSLDRAASLIGQCSSNYAHWLTETLPKLPILDSSTAYAEWPLLIDSGLHPNILTSIGILNKNRRQIIQVERWQPVCLKRLQVTTAPGYERYVSQGLDTSEPAPYRNVFSYDALQLLRSSVAEVLQTAGKPETRRVYLMRSRKSGNLRRLENAVEVENILRCYDIKAVIPEEMSFQEQAIICLDAELIIAPIGATLANMIFAPKGCRVIILAPYYVGANYFYYTHLAAVLGHELTYVLGPQVGPKLQAMHRNYRIEIDDLLTALR